MKNKHAALVFPAGSKSSPHLSLLDRAEPVEKLVGSSGQKPWYESLTSIEKYLDEKSVDIK